MGDISIMKEFLVGLFFLLAFTVLAAFGFFLFPFFMLLAFFLRIFLFVVFVIFGIWLLGKVIILFFEELKQHGTK